MVTRKRMTQAALTALVPMLLACGQQTAQRKVTVDVVPQDIAVETTVLPDGLTGQPYQNADGTPVVLAASGGVAPYTWSVTGGALPVGVGLDLVTGTLAGVPFDVVISAFDVTVADSAGATATASLTITVNSGDLSVTAPSGEVLPTIIKLLPYSFQFDAAGGDPPYTWSVLSGALPPGITLTVKGLFSGESPDTGHFEFTIEVKDSGGGSAYWPHPLRQALHGVPKRKKGEG